MNPDQKQPGDIVTIRYIGHELRVQLISRLWLGYSLGWMAKDAGGNQREFSDGWLIAYGR